MCVCVNVVREEGKKEAKVAVCYVTIGPMFPRVFDLIAVDSLAANALLSGDKETSETAVI